MRNYLVHITLILCFGFSACGKPSTSENTSQSPANVVRPRVESTDTGVKNDIAKFAAEGKGKVGTGALNIETGEYFSLDGDGHYPLQSVYKLPISLAVVSAFERDHRDLDEKVEVVKADMVRLGQYSPIRDKYPNGTTLPVRELIRYAVEESDGTASDVLLRVLGGPEKVQIYLGTLGITDMKVVNSEKELGANWQTQYASWSTPAAAVDLLQALYEGKALSLETDHQMILQMMTNSTPGKDRIRGMLGAPPSPTRPVHPAPRMA